MSVLEDHRLEVPGAEIFAGLEIAERLAASVNACGEVACWWEDPTLDEISDPVGKILRPDGQALRALTQRDHVTLKLTWEARKPVVWISFVDPFGLGREDAVVYTITLTHRANAGDELVVTTVRDHMPKEQLLSWIHAASVGP